MNKEGVVKLLPSSFLKKKKIVTMTEIWAGALSSRSLTCLKPMAGHRI